MNYFKNSLVYGVGGLRYYDHDLNEWQVVIKLLDDDPLNQFASVGVRRAVDGDVVGAWVKTSIDIPLEPVVATLVDEAEVVPEGATPDWVPVTATATHTGHLLGVSVDDEPQEDAFGGIIDSN